MASDILFGKHGTWSARMIGFSELLDRVQTHYGTEDAPIREFLTLAKDVGCLNVDQVENPSVRIRLVEHILASANEWLEELRADSPTDLKEIAGVQKLVDLTEKYLAELHGGARKE